MNASELNAGLASPVFRELDRQFAALMERLAGGNRPELRLAAALVSQRLEDGDVCLDLAREAGTPVFGPGLGLAPEVVEWRQALREADSVVGVPGEIKPLILDTADRLYLRRYEWYEAQVAEAIRQRCAPIPRAELPFDDEQFRQALERWFPGGAEEIHWPRVGAFAAVRSRWSLIVGGPGTGKTTTVVRLLGVLMELQLVQPERVALAAPTGKAAARLHESIVAQKLELARTTPLARELPEDVRTLHRLLRPLPNSTAFQHDPDHPLPVDVLVVDEASMVDLALMAKLLRALPATTRVVLLGDRSQLASVQAGNLLSDLVEPAHSNQFTEGFSAEFARISGTPLPVLAQPTTVLTDHCVELQRSHRFGPTTAIYQLSEAVQRGDVTQALQWLRRGDRSGKGSVVGRSLPSRLEVSNALAPWVEKYYLDNLRAADGAHALRTLNQFRILAAVREGPQGVLALNRGVEQILQDRDPRRRLGEWYHGRQILITSNDYATQLFNGDLGVVWNPSGKDPKVWFQSGEGGERAFSPERLPGHETAFALTIHKSQGSEFTEVLLVLPERPARVLSRELLYTGLTRARDHTEVWFSEAVLRVMMAERTQRASGLADRLRTP